jgi:hypothetical protein
LKPSSSRSNLIQEQAPAGTGRGNGASKADAKPFGSLARTMGQMIFYPGSFYEGLDIDEGYGKPLIFLFVMSSFFSLLSCIYMTEKRPLFGAILFLNHFFTPFITALALYCMTWLSKGNRFSYKGLFAISAYADITSLFAWIPGLGVISGLWRFYLIGLGMTKKGNIKGIEACIYIFFCAFIIFLLIRLCQAVV